METVGAGRGSIDEKGKKRSFLEMERDNPSTVDTAPKSKVVVPTATTTELGFDIPGVIIEDRQAKAIFEKLCSVCGWRNNTFPGSQPVSLSSANINQISRNGYVVCEKSDGIRFLLFAAAGGIFLMDRKKVVRRIEMHLPRRGSLDESHQVTLLDGELVQDQDPVEQEVSQSDDKYGMTDIVIKKQPRIRFLIYDAIAIQRDVGLKDFNLLYRLSQVATEVIQPLREYYTDKKRPAPLDIYLKDFFDIWDIDSIYNFSGKLPHLSDGLIFTPVRLPYTPGTCTRLLKWKPPHLNTVDFSADMLYDLNNCPRIIMLYVGDRGLRVFKGHFAAPYGDEYKKLMEKAIYGTQKIRQLIVECYWVPNAPVTTFIPLINEKLESNANNECPTPYDYERGLWFPGGWVIERVRKDKTTANDIRVVYKVMESIEDGITFDDLKSSFERFRSQGKRSNAEMCKLPDYYYKNRTEYLECK